MNPKIQRETCLTKCWINLLSLMFTLNLSGALHRGFATHPKLPYTVIAAQFQDGDIVEHMVDVARNVETLICPATKAFICGTIGVVSDLLGSLGLTATTTLAEGAGLGLGATVAIPVAMVAVPVICGPATMSCRRRFPRLWAVVKLSHPLDAVPPRESPSTLA